MLPYLYEDESVYNRYETPEHYLIVEFVSLLSEKLC